MKNGTRWLLLTLFVSLGATGALIHARMGFDPGVAISTDWDEYIPPSWTKEPYARTYSPLRKDQADAIRKALRVLRKYPSSVLRATCRKVIVVSDLEFQHMPISGTNWNDYIVVSYDPRGEEFEMTIHHELSSLFLRKFENTFSKERWIACNPQDFAYLGSSPAAVEAGRLSLELDDKDIPDGFLCAYSTATMEDDFNVIIENLFVPSTEFRTRIAASSRLKRKVDLAIQFYRSIGIELKMP